jgi:UDP-N-acetylmuramate dehydrogenase
VTEPGRVATAGPDRLVHDLRDAGVASVVPAAALATLTTLRVGGPARALVTVERDEDLGAVGRVCRQHDVPWIVVGRGSNLLLPDDGWPGVAIVLGRGFRGLEIPTETGETGRLRAGAAEPLPTLAVRIADAGFRGFAWACAVPGTLGGAVRMNAGAHGGDMSDHLVEVELVRLGTGAREVCSASVLEFAYRHSVLPDDAIVVAATLELERGDPATIRAEIDDIRAWRRTHQPLHQPNCGSVFTNPPGDSAGRLIESAGGKGIEVGGARVSDRHANFIVTRPGATASDVWAVISEVQQLVRDRFAIELTTEVVRPQSPWAGGS